MFTLLPDPSAPTIRWIGQNAPLLILGLTALAAFVWVVMHSRGETGSGYLGFTGADDCQDGGDGGGDCSGD
ncbi:MAG TPA: hypothetical protein VGC77_03340 [Rhodopseudomonas sp.]|uniref:hypothetical protein n=1 Tax=Rhodopseudomonas sp. TaxID=1078 RepID=UPI002ED7F9DF